MSCSPFDLRDYFLKELAKSEQSQVEAHVKTCQPCREELEQLRVTGTALFSLRDEEIPQRIAFVSDPVWRRGFAAFWGSSARLAFAGAAMLSGAIVFSALHAPVGQVAELPKPVTVVQSLSEAEIQARVDAAVGPAVAKAIAATEVRQAEKFRQVTAELEQTRQRLLWAASEYEMQGKRNRTAVLSAGLYQAPPSSGEPK